MQHMMLALLLDGGRAAEAAELSLCPAAFHRGQHRILRSSHIEIKNTHMLHATTGFLTLFVCVTLCQAVCLHPHHP